MIITGAAQGLGKSITATLAREGAYVYAADIRSENITKTANELKNSGLEVFPLVLDVTDPSEILKTLKDIIAENQVIHGVVNNAAIDIAKSINEVTIDEWTNELKVNLFAPFYMTKYVFPVMEKQGGGYIINIASTAAKRAWEGASAYHASKWGLLGFSEASLVEGRKKNIKVTTIIAGGMRTPFILDRFPDVSPDVLQDPNNVANAVKFALLQPEGTVISEMMVLPTKETSWP